MPCVHLLTITAISTLANIKFGRNLKHIFHRLSTKLNSVRQGSHLDSWRDTNTPSCNNLSFFPSLSKAILKTAELPNLVQCLSSIPQLFVRHFAISAFTCIYLQHRINKQPNASFEFFSILLTFDRLKQQLRSYC